MASPSSTTSASDAAFHAGSALFVDEEYEEAVAHFKDSVRLALDEVEEEGTPHGDKVPLFEKYAKLASGLLKLDQHSLAAESADLAVEHQIRMLQMHREEGGEEEGASLISSDRPYFIKGVASFHCGEFRVALDAFNEAVDRCSKASKVKSYRTWIRKCEAELLEGAVPAPVLEEQEAVVSEPAAEAPPQAPSASSTPSIPRFRHEWYQTHTHVVLTIFAKKQSKETCTWTFEDESVRVDIKPPEEYSFAADLYDAIVPSLSQAKITGAKVEIKLAKVTPGAWPAWTREYLHSSEHRHVVSASLPSSSTASLPPAYSSRSGTNWDKLEADLKKEEEKEEPEGEEALNKLFRGIYKNASAETRRAMVKSFQTSGGTVLSTNWDEVKDKDYENNKIAPEGMEWRTWEGDKDPRQVDDKKT